MLAYRSVCLLSSKNIWTSVNIRGTQGWWLMQDIFSTIFACAMHTKFGPHEPAQSAVSHKIPAPNQLCGWISSYSGKCSEILKQFVAFVVLNTGKFPHTIPHPNLLMYQRSHPFFYRVSSGLGLHEVDDFLQLFRADGTIQVTIHQHHCTWVRRGSWLVVRLFFFLATT